VEFVGVDELHAVLSGAAYRKSGGASMYQGSYRLMEKRRIRAQSAMTWCRENSLNLEIVAEHGRQHVSETTKVTAKLFQ
jgi:hypothetical protein